MDGGGGSEDSSVGLCNALEAISFWASSDLWFITHISSSSPEEDDEPSSSLCEALLNDVVMATSSSSPESDVSPSFFLDMKDLAVALACNVLLDLEMGDNRAALEDSDPVENDRFRPNTSPMLVGVGVDLGDRDRFWVR